MPAYLFNVGEVVEEEGEEREKQTSVDRKRGGDVN